jgi:cytochrome c oxidase subunit 3
MSAHAASEHAGPPPGYGNIGQIDRVMVGLVTFLASEAMLFGSFFTAFFYIRYSSYTVFPPHPYEIPKNPTGINTAILISSSFTMHWALVSIKRNNRKGLILGLLFTVILGLTFLGVQLHEYATIGFTPQTGAFASTFFCLTGLHGTHVFVGATLLTIALVRSLRGHYSPEHHMGVELTGIYWHFVDFVWVILYATVYLIAPS